MAVLTLLVGFLLVALVAGNLLLMSHSTAHQAATAAPAWSGAQPPPGPIGAPIRADQKLQLP